jgi:hypothetical protein
MGLKIFAIACASILALATLAPEPAFARDGDRRDRGGHHYDRGHSDHGWRDGRHRRHRRHNDDGAAIAAGVLGLALGLALAASVSDDDGPQQAQCWDNYQRCAPGQAYGQPYAQPNSYAAQSNDEGYSAYEEDYGPAPQQSQRAPQYAAPDGRGGCITQVEQWDPVAGRYTLVNLRRPCER